MSKVKIGQEYKTATEKFMIIGEADYDLWKIMLAKPMPRTNASIFNMNKQKLEDGIRSGKYIRVEKENDKNENSTTVNVSKNGSI